MSIYGNLVGAGAPRADWAQTDESKADFIRNKPVEAMESARQTAEAAKKTAEAALARTGGTMTGDINMGSKKITSLAAPTADTDAATKQYVDSRKVVYTATLPASGWSGSASAGYYQSVAIDGLLVSDEPIVDLNPEVGAAKATVSELDDAWTPILMAVNVAGKLYVRFYEKPTLDIPIKLKVVR